MLTLLKIRNLALVDELVWEPQPGFLGITGETGAGKSVIMGGIALVMGERADKSMIRSGETQCSIEAVFHLAQTDEINAKLEAAGANPCEEGELLVRRVITPTGNRQFINNSPVTLHLLREVAGGLVDMHHPEAHRSLTSQQRQLCLLDAYAEDQEELEAYQSAYRLWTAARQAHRDLLESEMANERELDFLRHQVEEIEEAAFTAEEVAGLEERWQRARNASRLRDTALPMAQMVDGDDNSLLSELRRLVRSGRELERLDASATSWLAPLEGMIEELESVGESLQSYVDGLCSDPAEFAALEARIALLDSLRRKYGQDWESIEAHLADCRRRLDEADNREERLQELAEREQARRALPIAADISAEEAARRIGSAQTLGLALDGAGLDSLTLCDGEGSFTLSWAAQGEDYNGLLRLIFSDGVKKCAAGVKDIMGLALAEGLGTGGFVFDTALAGYVLDPTESGYDTKKLSRRHLGAELPEAQAVLELMPVMREKLEAAGAARLYDDIELPLCAVLARMEQKGFYVDKKALSDFGESLTASIDALQRSIWRRAGHEFNINSPKQLGDVLFEELMLPAGKKTKTGWSTNAEVLEKLVGKHEIIGEILDYRMLTKLKSTYADGLLKVISADGRIHTNFKMTVTATGRLSSTEPNLQNIPVRRELGAQVRRMFVAGPGCLLVDADYSQIELRLLAHISGDETMREAFRSGEDIHRVTASQVFGVPVDEVTPQMRGSAKAVNFGIVYGISAFSLAQDIKVKPAEAKAYIEAYLEKYHGVREYMDRVIKEAKERGYVETLFGRRRPVPELKASNFNTRSFGERVARNMPIQGTAADIIKLAMVNVQRRFEGEGLEARLILQVHDELIAECPESEAERVAALLEEEMERAVTLSVPLIAEAHSGRSWAEAH